MQYTPGEVLRKVLRDNGWTQVQLAKHMGYDHFHINRIVNGHSVITPEFLWRFYETFVRDEASPLFFDTASDALDKLSELTGQPA